ncbi:hypothetical protein CPB86DRAFT_873834 [Serendipita vermifera]|nr:hypothetical protein CPB86DRAFT_873834 [Serendipita vermifera]
MPQPISIPLFNVSEPNESSDYWQEFAKSISEAEFWPHPSLPPFAVGEVLRVALDKATTAAKAVEAASEPHKCLQRFKGWSDRLAIALEGIGVSKKGVIVIVSLIVNKRVKCNKDLWARLAFHILSQMKGIRFGLKTVADLEFPEYFLAAYLEELNKTTNTIVSLLVGPKPPLTYHEMGIKIQQLDENLEGYFQVFVAPLRSLESKENETADNSGFLDAGIDMSKHYKLVAPFIARNLHVLYFLVTKICAHVQELKFLRRRASFLCAKALSLVVFLNEAREPLGFRWYREKCDLERDIVQLTKKLNTWSGFNCVQASKASQELDELYYIFTRKRSFVENTWSQDAHLHWEDREKSDNQVIEFALQALSH